MPVTEYGDITPRTAAFLAKELLIRALPYLVLERFGQTKEIPRNETKSIKFRRYEAIPKDVVPLVEGVTPASVKPTHTDVTVTLKQYGKLVTISDVITDTHEDPILREVTQILAEQAAQTLEAVRFGVLKAGTNVIRSLTTSTTGTGARTTVSFKITDIALRKAVRTLERGNARKFSQILKSSPSYDTHGVQPSYFAVMHVDCDVDVRTLTGFIAAENYGTEKPVENEIGAARGVRFIKSTVIEPWEDAGDTIDGTSITTSGVRDDVYPYLIFARDAYAVVPLKGKGAITPMVVNPKPSDSDPLGQRGHVSWKAYHAAVILNDAFMVRIEALVTD